MLGSVQSVQSVQNDSFCTCAKQCAKRPFAHVQSVCAKGCVRKDYTPLLHTYTPLPLKNRFCTLVLHTPTFARLHTLKPQSMKPNTTKIKIAHLALAIIWRLAALITGALLALLILGSLS